MTSTTYYQIGGFQPSVQWYSFKTPTFGIKRTGTSHLLLTKNQTLDFIHAHQLSPPLRGKRPIPLSDFESVSPIHFRKVEDLVKKLSTLKPKSQKSRSPTDNSQANKYFVSGEEGIPRALFEHCRIFYDIVQGRISSLEKFGLQNPDWLPSLRIFSFTFNTFVNDTRPIADRLRNPRKPGTSHHFRVLENISLGGTTRRHEELSLNFLRKLGFDVSGWKSGMKNLLGYPDPVKDEYTERKDHSRRLQFYPIPPFPPRRPAPATVHVVDIHQLYLKLMQTEYAAETIPRMSQGLGCDVMEGWPVGRGADDEEQDPNDFVPTGSASRSTQYADPETDSTDYGSDG
ncbi:hypothetical protein BD779DRAFT_1545823 [Infundibulicybe gibba]|nr:hypothetical protein BD779DRAFT_1545823 [Infundibulicybe gibba]